jgi:hypothetical protein
MKGQAFFIFCFMADSEKNEVYFQLWFHFSSGMAPFILDFALDIQARRPCPLLTLKGME